MKRNPETESAKQLSSVEKLEELMPVFEKNLLHADTHLIKSVCKAVKDNDKTTIKHMINIRSLEGTLQCNQYYTRKTRFDLFYDAIKLLKDIKSQYAPQ